MLGHCAGLISKALSSLGPLDVNLTLTGPGTAEGPVPSFRPETGLVHSYFLAEPSICLVQDEANFKAPARYKPDEKFHTWPTGQAKFGLSGRPGPVQCSNTCYECMPELLLVKKINLACRQQME